MVPTDITKTLGVWMRKLISGMYGITEATKTAAAKHDNHIQTSVSEAVTLKKLRGHV